MQKLGDKQIKSIHPGDRNISGSVVSKKRPALFGFFASSKAETFGRNTATLLKEPVLKSSHLDVPRTHLTAVRNWVALEEKIVHDYKEQKTPQFKSAVPLPKTPAKQLLPAFETFSTQTAVSSFPGVPKLKKPLRVSKKNFPGIAVFLWVCAGLVAGVFVYWHIQETFLNREISQKLSRIQNEKEQLGRSYAALKNVSEDQGAEMKWLNNRLHDMALELKTAKADKVAYEQGLEKKYREELMKITVRYESELDRLRGTLQTQEDIVKVLKAQSKAFDKIVDQAGMSALSGAAAGLSRGSFSTGGTSALQGEVTSINGRQGSIVINLGSEQGVLSGRLITISRSGIGLAVGSIDRVYPTMSVALVRDARMLQVIQGGDTVSFS